MKRSFLKIRMATRSILHPGIGRFHLHAVLRGFRQRRESWNGSRGLAYPWPQLHYAPLPRFSTLPLHARSR
jgi:hypothetical protein